MRTLRYVAFLLIVFAASIASAYGPFQAGVAPSLSNNDELVRKADGVVQFRVAPTRLPRSFTVDPMAHLRRNFEGPYDPDNTCYFIRSYVMAREGETGATHLDHVTTCTPQSRIRMKTKVRFTPAIVQTDVVK